jgi:hypothetical protein
MTNQRYRRTTTVLLVALIWARVVSAGEERTTRSYSLPGHGSLEVKVPSSWRDDIRQPRGTLPPTITLRPTGNRLELLITPLWSPTNEKGFSSLPQVHQMIDHDWQEVLSSAVEKRQVLEHLDGEEAHGYFFMVTDKAPKPGEYEYMIRACVGVGDLALSVTILTHDKDSDAVQAALSALRDVRHRAP